MRPSRCSLLNTLVDIQVFARQEAESVPPSIIVHGKYSDLNISVKGVPLSAKRLAVGYHDCLNHATELVLDLLHGWDEGGIDISMLSEEFHKKDVGYSFQYPDWLPPKRNPTVRFLSYLRHKGVLFSGGDAEPNVEMMRSCLATYDSLMKDILFLVHVGGGMPARGTELCSYMRTNGQDRRTRSLFLSPTGEIFLFALHNKTDRMTDRMRPIVRYLDHDLSALMIIDHICLRPLMSFINSKLPVGPNNRSPVNYDETMFAINQKAVSADKFGKVFNHHCKKYVQANLQVSTYRQAVKHFVRHGDFTGITSGLLANEGIPLARNRHLTELISSKGFGHALATGELRYGVTPSQLPNLSFNTVELMHLGSSLWHGLMSDLTNRPSIYTTSPTVVNTRTARYEVRSPTDASLLSCWLVLFSLL